MPTYYKYVEREADSYVDWGAIGKSMSDMLLEKDKIRNEKRAALDEASRQFGEVLANAPQGEHVGARQQALEYANNASQFMRMQDVLLKSGQLDLRDYTIARQNILDDTERAFKMNEAYQKMFKEKMDRYKEDKSSLYEVEAMERVEGFGNFSQSGLWINPTTGKVSVAMKDLQKVNGKDVYVMAENPNNMTSIDAINGLILGQWNRYDSEGATTALAEMNGKQIDSMMSSGAITKVEDILQKPDYINAETNYINSALGGSDSFDRVSLLTDSMVQAPNGKQYRFTRDEADAKANPEAILMKINPASGQESPQISDEQMKDSTEWMRTRARSKYDYEKTITQKQQRQIQWKPQYVSDAETAQRQKEDTVSQWVKIFTEQNPADKDAAAHALLGMLQNQNAGVIAVKPNANGVYVKWADGREQTIEYKNGANDKSGSQWAAAGSVLTGVNDNNIFGKYKDATLSNLDDTGWNSVTGAEYVMPTTTSTTPTDYGSEVRKDTGQYGYIAEDDDEKTAQHLNTYFGKYGIIATTTGSSSADEIRLTGKDANGNEVEKVFNVDNQNEVPLIRRWIENNYDRELVKSALQLKTGGTTGGAAGGVGAKYNKPG